MSPNKNRAPDPRPARTRAALIAAAERISDRGQEISISAIVSEAGLSRSSFYAQYTDLGHLATQELRTVFDVMVNTYLQGREQGLNESQASAAGILPMLKEFTRRHSFYVEVLKHTPGYTVYSNMVDMLAQALLPATTFSAPPSVNLDFATRFMAAGALSVIFEWLASDDPATEAEIQAQLIEMTPVWLTGDLQQV